MKKLPFCRIGRGWSDGAVLASRNRLCQRFLILYGPYVDDPATPIRFQQLGVINYNVQTIKRVHVLIFGG